MEKHFLLVEKFGKAFPCSPQRFGKACAAIVLEKTMAEQEGPKGPKNKKGMPWGSGTGQEGPQTVECLGAGRPQLPKPFGQPSGSLGKGPEKVPAEAAGRAPEGHGF